MTAFRQSSSAKMARAGTVGTLVAVAILLVLSPAATAQEAGPATKPAASTTPPAQKVDLRQVRFAVFDFDVLKGVDLEPAALTDQVNTMLSGLEKVTIVNRDQMKKVADEHKMALSGLVDTSDAAKLGKFLSANYVVARPGEQDRPD